MNDKLIEYLDHLMSKLDRVEDFAAEQIPDVAHQWLAWEFWYNLSLISLFLGIAIFMYYVLRHANKKLVEVKKSERDGPGCCCVFSIVAIIASLYYAGSYGVRVAKIVIAPKVVLIEAIAELARGKK